MPGGAGTPVGSFEFLVDVEFGEGVEIGTLVSADTVEGVVVGAVVDMRTVGTDTDPVRAETSRVPHPEKIGYLPAVKCARVQVLAAKAMRSVGPGAVRAATKEEVATATGQADMQWPIPIGTVKLADGSSASVCVEGTFLAGPEAQGLGVYGRSGVASKTSFMTTAIRSVLNQSTAEHRTAAVMFNVKGTDLIWIDQPAEDDRGPTEEDLNMYEAMELEPGPFTNVEVWSPALPVGDTPRSSREDALLLRWDLRMVWRYLPMFLPNMYGDEKILSFVAQFEDLLLRHPVASQRIDTFDKFDGWLRAEIDEAEENRSDQIWNNRVHIATARRIRRIFSGLRARGNGLFTGGKANDSDDIPLGGWQEGEVKVIDIAGLDSDVQGFVIARTVDRIMTAAEEGTLGEVDHVIAAMDEGASITAHSTVKKSLQRVASQGRYAGVSLFIATQAASDLDDVLRNNAASRAVGSSAETELASGVHGRLPAGLMERLATLPNGQMAVWHTRFRQSIVVNFPRPAWHMGKSRTTAGSKPTTSAGLIRQHLGDKAYSRVTAGLDERTTEEIIATTGDVDAATDALKKAADQTPNTVHEPRSFDPDNPFDMS